MLMVGRNLLTELNLILLFFHYFYTGELYGLEKFWAFSKYYKQWSSLTVDPFLLKKLDEYKTIDDFRLDVNNQLI